MKLTGISVLWLIVALFVIITMALEFKDMSADKRIYRIIRFIIIFVIVNVVVYIDTIIN